MAVGRRPNGQADRRERGGCRGGRARLHRRGQQLHTNVPHIFAIGDVVGQPMLAHKAVHEGKVAAEVDRRPQAGISMRGVIPSVAYTDPEVAWAG